MTKKTSITFEVEKLKRAKNPLKQTSFEQISKQFSEETIIGSADGKEFVYAGKYSFLRGMQLAYADHRPFVLSPDMIWLLICQGFSKHVEVNAEKLRHLFVDFERKKELEIRNDNLLEIDKIKLKAEWEKSINEMNDEVAKYIGEDLINNLTADFSTTSLTEKIVSQITVLNTFQPYFNYEFSTILCGIPQITLEGTIEDWKKVIDKSKKLVIYELDWWISELLPILEEIKETANGKIDKQFWMNMFKQHALDEYGASDIIDGWIVQFFPYFKDGRKTNLFSIRANGFKYLPDQIVNVPFLRKITDDGGILIETKKQEFLGGFFGLEQDKKDLSLRPVIEWSIISERKFINETIQDIQHANLIYSNITEFPMEVLALDKIGGLTLSYKGKVKLPKELSEKRIQGVSIEGEIEDENYVKECLKNTVEGRINGVRFENKELRAKLRAEREKEQEEKRKQTFLYKLKNLFN